MMGIKDNLSKALQWRLKRWCFKINTRRALWKRSKRLSHVRFVGITGSAGKTMTKDLAVSVLSQRWRARGNHAGLNYLDDMAKLILSLRGDEQFCVVELAINKPGEIDKRIALVRPEIVAFTVVGRDHIKNYGSVEGIAKEKAKAIEALPDHGVAVLNMDDPLVHEAGKSLERRKLWFGSSAEADLRLISCESTYPDPLTLEIEYQGVRRRFATSLHGTHLAVPALAAIGIGLAADLSLDQCIEGICAAQTTDGRMQIASAPDGIDFIRDDFKAPHWSFQMALDYLDNAKAKRKVAVIGTLSDYSLSASKLYPKVARKALTAADLVVFVGPHALRALKARTEGNAHALHGFTETEDADRFLHEHLKSGDLVLLKGSNRADHLVRLFLSRTRTVNCWSQSCGWNRFCDACPRLDQVPPVKLTHSRETLSDRHDVDVQSDTGGAHGVAAKDSSSWLVVGLGNEGDDYTGTPHNAGFDAIDRLASDMDAQWSRNEEGNICEIWLADKKLYLFKAHGLINRTGPAVHEVCRHLSIPASHVLVIHDDADLRIGDVRFKAKGSDGGHKGLRSVLSSLENDGFMPRIRIGVRFDQNEDSEARSIVLERFTELHQPALSEAFGKVLPMLEGHITESHNHQP